MATLKLSSDKLGGALRDPGTEHETGCSWEDGSARFCTRCPLPLAKDPGHRASLFLVSTLDKNITLPYKGETRNITFYLQKNI